MRAAFLAAFAILLALAVPAHAQVGLTAPAINQAVNLQIPPAGPPIAGYQTWHDASNTTVGNSNSVWKDESGNGYDAPLVSVTGANPSLTSNSINGLQAYTFSSASGNAGYFQTTSGAIPYSDNFALFIVYQTNDLTNGQTEGIVGGNYDVVFDVRDTTGAVSGNTVNDFIGGNGPINNASGGFTPGTTYCITILMNQAGYSGKKTNVLINNTLAATNTGTTFSSGATYLYLGHCLIGSSVFNEKLGEVIWYNTAFTLAQAATTYNYLHAKWGC